MDRNYQSDTDKKPYTRDYNRHSLFPILQTLDVELLRLEVVENLHSPLPANPAMDKSSIRARGQGFGLFLEPSLTRDVPE